MSLSDVIKFIKTALYWFLLAAAMGVPFICSLYVLVTPRHRLLEAWQNYKMRRTKKVLKDRHFKNIPRIIKLMKFVSFLVFIASAWTICWELGVIDYWPPQDWWRNLSKYF